MDLEMDPEIGRHPVLRAIEGVGELLSGVTEVPVDLMSTGDNRRALLAVAAAQARARASRCAWSPLLAASPPTTAAATSRPG